MLLKAINSDATIAWLGQFRAEDQSAAIELLRAIKIISRDAFAEELRSSILHHLGAGEFPIALYAERELPQRLGVPLRLFKESKTKRRRAFGIGPAPVKSIRGYQHDVGSVTDRHIGASE